MSRQELERQVQQARERIRDLVVTSPVSAFGIVAPAVLERMQAETSGMSKPDRSA
jgi:hypothetical protein